MWTEPPWRSRKWSSKSFIPAWAFLEETAWLLARFHNVYGNLETTSTFLVKRPMAFTQAMAGLLAQGGAQVLDKLLWAHGIHAPPGQPGEVLA